MQKAYDEFERRDTVVIAVAQEDKDLESHGKIRANFKPSPRFEIVADVGRRETKRYHQTSSYLIDREGVVRQIFPMLIHSRGPWSAILGEIDAMTGTP